MSKGVTEPFNYRIIVHMLLVADCKRKNLCLSFHLHETRVLPWSSRNY